MPYNCILLVLLEKLERATEEAVWPGAVFPVGEDPDQVGAVGCSAGPARLTCLHVVEDILHLHT